MAKRKVLILTAQLTGGGVEKIMQDVANYLASKEDQYEVTVISLIGADTGREFLSDNITVKGVFRSAAAYKKWSPAWIGFRVKQLAYCIALTMGHYDIVLAIKDHWFIKLLAHMKANRKIAWVHSTSITKNEWVDGVYFHSSEEIRKCMERCDEVICVSKYVKDCIINYCGDPGNLRVCHNPLNAFEIAEKAAAPMETALVQDMRPVFVAVNRLSSEKNMATLLEAAERLNKDYTFSLWIVGDGEEKDNLDKYILEHQLDNVTMFGWHNNPYPFMKAADWFVSTSKAETFGLTIQEANILGKPGLVAYLPVFDECVDPEKNIFMENSLEGVCEGVKRVLDGKAEVTMKTDLAQLQKEFYTNRIEAIEGVILGQQAVQSE